MKKQYIALLSVFILAIGLIITPFQHICYAKEITNIEEIMEKTTFQNNEYDEFIDTFDKLESYWTARPASWTIADNEYQKNNNAIKYDRKNKERGELVKISPNTCNVTETEVWVKDDTASYTIGITNRYKDADHNYLFAYTKGTGLRFIKRDGKDVAINKTIDATFKMAKGQKYIFKLESNANEFKFYVDDVLKFTESDDTGTTYDEGKIGLYASNVIVYFDNFKITSKKIIEEPDEIPDEIDPLIDVVAIDWASFANGKPTDAASKQVEDILLNAVKYNINVYYADNFLQQTGKFLDLGGIAENNIRPAVSAAIGIATAIKMGIYDEDKVGVSKEEATKYAVRLTVSAAHSHLANISKGWGNGWQTAMWANLVGTAGWILWDELKPIEQQYVRKMVEFEANRFIDYKVLYYMNKNGIVIYKGDSKCEENAWNSGIMQLATSMMPNHPNWDKWMNKNIELMISAYSTPNDLKNVTEIHGRPVNAWLNGSNAFNDGTVVNHGRIHPDYMTSIGQVINAPVLYTLAKQSTPKASFFNANIVYRALVDVDFANPPYNAPGGTLYVDDSADIYYPQGNDWGTHRRMNFAMMDVYADAFEFDDLVDQKGAYWQSYHAGMVLDMQNNNSHNDGRTYNLASEDTYDGREQWVSLLAARAYQAKWIINQNCYRMSDETYIPYEKPEPPVIEKEDYPIDRYITYYSESFDAIDSSIWTPGKDGIWSIIADGKNNILKAYAKTQSDQITSTKGHDITDYSVIKLKARFTEEFAPNPGLGISFRQSEGNYYQFRLSKQGGSGMVKLYKCVIGENSGKPQLIGEKAYNYELGEWYNFEIRTTENRIKCLINGEKLIDIQDDSHKTGDVGLWMYKSAIEFDDLSIQYVTKETAPAYEISNSEIFWKGIDTQIRLNNNDLVVVDNAKNYKVPKYILENHKDTAKTLTLKFGDGEVTITKEIAARVSYDKSEYSFAELSALCEEKPVTTPKPTPIPTEKPTEPPIVEKTDANLTWLWILLAIIVGSGVIATIVIVKRKKK